MDEQGGWLGGSCGQGRQCTEHRAQSTEHKHRAQGFRVTLRAATGMLAVSEIGEGVPTCPGWVQEGRGVCAEVRVYARVAKKRAGTVNNPNNPNIPDGIIFIFPNI